MPKVERLTPEQVNSALKDLPDWTVEDGKLHREYRFRDFAHAFGFIAACAGPIEKLDHHPEWTNVYGRVTVVLWTHSEGGITTLDLQLASTMEAFARKLS